MTALLTHQEKLVFLRKAMKTHNVDGFIVPRADEYQGENPAPYALRLAWLTGFTGSAGTAVVLADKAVVLTDGRYTIQVRQQVDAGLYETGDMTKTSIGQWLAEEGGMIGYDPMLHTPKQIEDIEKHTSLKPVPNLIDEIWENRPEKPASPVEIFPEALAGVASAQKRENVGKALQAENLDAAIITLPDSLCWLLNVRGSDVDYTPLALSCGIIDADGLLQWFIEQDRLPDAVRMHIGNGVEIAPPALMEKHLKQLSGKAAGLDFKRAPLWFKAVLEEAGAHVTDFKDPCIAPKAIKTQAEQDSIRRTHALDGAALVNFLCWLDKEAPKGKLTELDIDSKLLECRAAQPGFKGPSFPTIAGFGPNGAIVHYRATQKSHAQIKPPGLLLVDSGGQYEGGTTDITRTIVIGEITDEMRDNFTHVLKAHIAVASAVLPKGTTGIEVDKLARGRMLEAGLDYAHGTGHGVGCYLAVHEEAANFSPKGKDEVRAGMLISNEPGYYKEGAYGIRIESLVLVQENKAGQIVFETVSLAPVDRRAINKKLLAPREIEWLNAYHRNLREKVSPHLDGTVKDWLRAQTRPLLFPDETL